MHLQDRFNRPVIETELTQKYKQYLSENPKARRRDVALAVGASEAAVIDAQIGVKSLRLQANAKEIIEAFPNLGYVMILLRNEYVVHERKGIYQNVKINGAMGLVIADDRRIDLRLFLSQWKHAFAVCESTDTGERFSLQFFNEKGIAIQKLFLQPDSNQEAYSDLIDRFAEADQSTPLVFVEADEETQYLEDSAVDQAQLIEDWSNMTNVHQFMGILKNHGVNREQAFNMVGKQYAQEFDVTQLEDILRQIVTEQISIMCFVGNKNAIQIHTGEIHKVVRMGDWLNILDQEFNLHLLESGVARGWLIRKPTSDGIITSLELFDAEGGQLVQFFGQRTEGKKENPQWRALAEGVL